MDKLKKLLLVGAIGAIVAVVAKKVQAGKSEAGSPWQSADDPA